MNHSLLLSLFSLGFFGGFSHCVGMCGPFVLTQVENRLQKISLEKFSNFVRLRNLALLPYHLGRVTTYSFVGFFCSFLNKNLQDFSDFKILSGILLLLAALLFLNILFDKKYINFKILFQPKIFNNLNFLSKLFQNSQGFKGYLLGIVLGFIPCGLLYGAYLIAASINNPAIAALGMALFGLATFPSLFLTACGGSFFKITKFKIIAKIIILINVITLFLMAIKLFSNV